MDLSFCRLIPFLPSPEDTITLKLVCLLPFLISLLLQVFLTSVYGAPFMCQVLCEDTAVDKRKPVLTGLTSLVAQMVKNPLAMPETRVQLGWEDPLEKGSPLHYSCLENPIDRGAWRATVHEVTKSQTGLSN